MDTSILYMLYTYCAYAVYMQYIYNTMYFLKLNNYQKIHKEKANINFSQSKYVSNSLIKIYQDKCLNSDKHDKQANKQ